MRLAGFGPAPQPHNADPTSVTVQDRNSAALHLQPAETLFAIVMDVVLRVLHAVTHGMLLLQRRVGPDSMLTCL